MKRIIRKTALAACIFACALFAGCDVQSLSSLGAFSEVHAGEYECVRATLGGTDLLSLCRYVHLTLERGGTFTVSAKSKAGVLEEGRGRYDYDPADGALTLYAERGDRRYAKQTVLREGSFTITHTLGGRELIVQFRVKG